MRHSGLAYLLLLCFLFSKVSGIRLEKGFPLLRLQRQQVEELGNKRKLVTTSISRADIISKTVKNGGHQDESLLRENSTGAYEKHGGGNEKISKTNASTFSKYHEIVHENYPDLTDITEMDYSPARRKPPIHN